MSHEALPVDDLPLQPKRRQTRWLVAILQGATGVVFYLMLFGVAQLATPAKFVPLAAAFSVMALVAFALWPMTITGRGFSFIRLTIFGALVALVGAYLWMVAIDLAMHPSTAKGSYLSSFFWALFDPSRLRDLFGRSRDGIELAILTLGLYMFPISIGIAWVVALWGRNRS